MKQLIKAWLILVFCTVWYLCWYELYYHGHDNWYKDWICTMALKIFKDKEKCQIEKTDIWRFIILE